MEHNQKGIPVQKYENVVVSWISWHFFEVPKFLLVVWENYIVFGLNYFSVPLLLRTLFSPWRRYKWRYPKSFDVAGYFGTFISNVFSRMIGMVCRILFIVVGIMVQIGIVILGALAILFWVFLPLILVLSVLFVLFFLIGKNVSF